jgi:hypothetical protein
MGFLSPPKPPKPVPPANPAASPITSRGPKPALGTDPYGAGSLITTSASGLKRKATVSRVSLIGG